MAEAVLVDSNVILDVATNDPVWGDWSSETLARLADESVLIINPLIYAEVSIGIASIEGLDAILPPDVFRREPLPYEAGFLAGKAFMAYRRRGGAGAHRFPTFTSALTLQSPDFDC